MTLLVHMRCSVCNHKWSVPSKTIQAVVDDLEENGCPKNCSCGAIIYIEGHEVMEEYDSEQIVNMGYGTFEKF